MLSFTTLTNKCVSAASDSVNKQFFKDSINNGQKIVENELDDFIVENTRTGMTIAGFNQIPTPEDYVRTNFFYVQSASIRYDAQTIYSEEQWQRIVSVTAIQSNYVEYIFPRIDYIELYPTPSSSLPYTFQYVYGSTDMQYDDYKDGTIASITNVAPLGALPYATVAGVGTTWLPYMQGMWFQMQGDRQWYKISSVTDTTHLVLAKAYNGIAIAGFPTAFYTIGEMPHVPEAAHDLLYYYAMWQYYKGIKKDSSKAADFEKDFNYWLTWAKGTFANRTNQGVIPNQRTIGRFQRRNPNFFPMGLS